MKFLSTIITLLLLGSILQAQSGPCSGHGEFIQTGQWLGGMAWSMGVDVGDVNGDGHPDLVFARDQGLGNQVYLGDGSGLFTDTGQSLGTHNSRDMALADLDMDGDLDMVVANTQVGGPGQPNRIYFNDGLHSGNFIDSGQSLGNEESQSVATGDINGDTFIDLVFFNMGANCTVHLNDGNGGFGSPAQSLAMNRSFDGKLADLNGDGHLDLAITDIFNPDQKIYINDGSGTFTLHSSVTVSAGLFSIAAADVDGDSLPDLICGVNGANQIFINDGSANFTDSGQLFGTAGTSDIVAGDIDGDCDVDLVATDVDGFFRVYRNDGGNFIEIAVNDDNGVALQLADVNHDDTLDLIVASGIPDMVFLNLGPGSDCNGNGIPDSAEIAADPSIDCDENGTLDLCEISSDPSLDCDGNGVLDSCATEILASDGAFADSFGNAVSVNGDKVIVGAFGDDTVGGTEDGSAYLFRYDTSTLDWIEEAHLFPSAGAPDDAFGRSVSLGKNVAIVGAPYDDTPAGGTLAGSVYIFRFDTATMSWFEEAHLFASDGAAGDEFGTSVSISGTGVGAVAIVGARGANTSSGGTNAGAAYVYRHDGSSWVEEAKLIASDGTNGDQFGKSVSISGNAVLVGAWLYNGPSGSNTGSAYVYRYDGSNWIQESQLFHPIPTSSSDQFGTSVSLSGDVAIVGSKSNIGDATIFRWNGIAWTLETHLPSPPPSSGYTSTSSLSVDVSGDVAVVGGWNQIQPTGGSAGVAYLYRRTGTIWIQERALLPQDQSLNDYHGASVGVSGGIAIVGAPSHSHPSLPLFTGSAYLFNLGNDCDGNGLNDFCELTSNPSLDCNGNGIIDPCDIASGFSLDTDGSGVPDECEGMKYISGDGNGDGVVNVGDGIFVLDYLFGGGVSSCIDASDVNGDGVVDIGDAVYLLTYLFNGGSAPAAPFPDCGEDPSADALECDSFDGC